VPTSIRTYVIAYSLLLTIAGCGGGEERAPAKTVSFWMYGGDAKVNAYVDDQVAPALAEHGFRLRRVPVADTADAVKRVIAERRAGKESGGGVDLIWINGENFASGKQAGLWLEDWARALPNAKRYVDFSDPTIGTDFGVAVDGQESPWQRAAFVYAYDSAKLARPPADLDALLAYARRHPGRFTYPAPPDFTGSAFVRQVAAAKGEDAGFAFLRALKPLMYRGGRSFPKSQAELDGLFADGQVDFAMAYDANFVNAGVLKGGFPKTARPFVLGGGALSNTSYVTIPANAANIAGAKALADVLLDPELQAAKADPAALGNPTVLDGGKLGGKAALFARRAAASPYVLDDFGQPVPEFAAAKVGPLEQRWARDVLR
jgi:putative spermidine/putrescine transport system substrate-binding protein